MPATINSRQLPATCDATMTRRSQRPIERARHVLAAVLDRVDQVLLRDLPRRQQSDDDERDEPSATATTTVSHSMLKSRYGGKPPSAAITVAAAHANAEAAERAQRDQRHRFR